MVRVVCVVCVVYVVCGVERTPARCERRNESGLGRPVGALCDIAVLDG